MFLSKESRRILIRIVLKVCLKGLARLFQRLFSRAIALIHFQTVVLCVSRIQNQHLRLLNSSIVKRETMEVLFLLVPT